MNVGLRIGAWNGWKPNENAWIKGNGTGYIVPGFIRSETHIEAKIRVSNETQPVYNSFFGSEGSHRLLVRIQDDCVVFYAEGSGASKLYSIDYSAHKLIFNGGKYYLDGNYLGSRSILDENITFPIMTTSFREVKGYIQEDHASVNYLYYLKLFNDSGKLTRAFYARVMNGVVGMYDDVSKKFYPPTKGSFTYGIDAN